MNSTPRRKMKPCTSLTCDPEIVQFDNGPVEMALRLGHGDDEALLLSVPCIYQAVMTLVTWLTVAGLADDFDAWIAEQPLPDFEEWDTAFRLVRAMRAQDAGKVD